MRTNAGAIPAQTVSLWFLCGVWVWFCFAFPDRPVSNLHLLFAASGCTDDVRNQVNTVDPIERRALRIRKLGASRYLFVSTANVQSGEVDHSAFVLGASPSNHLQVVACHDCVWGAGWGWLKQNGLSVLQVSMNRVSGWWLIKASSALQYNFSLQGNTCTGSFRKRNFLDTVFFPN